MSVFEGLVLQQTVAVANKYKIDPASLLAVVEVESAGKSMESDGKTPCFLFERHIFYRELKKAGKMSQLVQAQAQDLANETWQPAIQYKDQGTSAKRLALFARARSIDNECAIRSASWGVGQTMGFLAEEMKFKNATAMLSYMMAGGVPAQIECMVREIQSKNLGPKLNAHNWAAFAKVYNGPGYATNHYDTKMATAYLKWAKAVLPTVQIPEPVKVPVEVKPPPMPAPASPATPALGIGAAIVAFFAGIWAFVQSTEFKIIAFAIGITVMGAITYFVLRHRRLEAEAIQLGTLASVAVVAVSRGESR